MPSSKAIQLLVLAILLAAPPFVLPQAASSNPQSIAEIENALRSGNFEQSLQLSHLALERSPRDHRLWTLCGMAYAGARKPELALSAYQHALRLAPNYLPALEGTAQIEYQQQNGQAKPLLERIVAIDPTNGIAQSMLAMIAYKTLDCPNAVKHFERAGAAIGSLIVPLNAYGDCLDKLERFEEAIPVLTRVVQLTQDETSRYNLALTQWDAGHAADAIATLQPVLDAGSTDEDTLTFAADLEESKDNTPKAVELLRAAILVNPKKMEAYLHFATISSNHKAYQVGIDMLNAGLTQIPDAAPLYLARAILNTQLGKTAQAMDDFEAAAKYDPQLSFLGTAEGLAEIQNDKLDEAVAKLRAQAKKHPDDALTHYLLAETLSTAGATEGSPQYREEIAAANRALELDPKLAMAHDLLAGTYLRSGKTDLAIEHSEDALKINPQDQEAIYHLILALRKTDRKGEIPALTQRLMALRNAASNHTRYQLVEGSVDESGTLAKR